MEWSVVEWSEVEWSEVEWNGAWCVVYVCRSLQYGDGVKFTGSAM